MEKDDISERFVEFLNEFYKDDLLRAVNEEKKSLEEILANTDLLAKVLLIEDLTEGGVHSIRHEGSDEEYGFLENGQQVYLDLEDDLLEFDSFRFMDRVVSIQF